MSEQPLDTASRRALHELIDLLREVDRRWVSPEWNLHTADDVVGAHRALMHYLQWGLVGLFERDPAAPRFHRIVAPDRKLLGDNPDAVYFDAPISADHAYRVTGETKGATYVSITVESGEAWGSMDNQVVGVLNDTSFDIDADGRFEILVGGEPRQRNWLALPEGAGSISTRHYFEDATHAAADPARVPTMRIEVVPGGGDPDEPDGTPLAPGGSPAVHDGNPATPGGSPAVHDGNPATPGGSPAVHDGNPATPGGSPSAHDGIPATPGGSPSAHDGIPATPGGSPSAHDGIPATPGGRRQSLGPRRHPRYPRRQPLGPRRHPRYPRRQSRCRRRPRPPPRRPARLTPPWPRASAGSPPSCASSPWTARRRASPSPVRGSRGCRTSSRPPASPATWAWPLSTPPTPWPRS